MNYNLKTNVLCLLALFAVLSALPAHADEPAARLVGMGEGHDSVPFQQIIDAGLLVVDINTVGGEWPTCDYVDAPEDGWGHSITNATRVPGRLRMWRGGQVAFDSGDFVQDAHGITIRIRGNTSAYGRKKPYKINLQEKGDLLLRNNPIYRDKDWLLIRDEYFKNMQGFEVNRYVGMTWTPAYRYVNLVINDEFQGLYMLVESVKRNTNCRLNVAKDGFIFEFDAYWWNSDFYIPSNLSNSQHYTFKYPSSDDLTAADIDYITQVIRDYEQSVFDATYSDYIDVESFAKWCLGHDILSTFDAGGTNTYYTKANRTADAHLSMPVMWDFDSSESDSLRWSRCHGVNFLRLFRSANRDFVLAYTNKWKEIREHIVGDLQNVFQRFKNTTDGLALPRSMQLNNARWNVSLLSLGSLDSRAKWFADRFPWLDNAINELLPKGDINLDGSVDVNDVNLAVNMILELMPANLDHADLNGDSRVDIADLNELIGIILNAVPVEPVELELSARHVDIAYSGGTAFVDVSATKDWRIEEADIPEWLSVEPRQGTAGGTTVIFAADSTTTSRSALLRIVCGTRTDTITVDQLLPPPTSAFASIADFLNADPLFVADTCAITGVVTDIEVIKMGRVTLRDWSGATFASGVMRQPEFKTLKVGDIATVSGKRVVVNDLPQISAARFDSICAVRRVDIADFATIEAADTDWLMLSGTITLIVDEQRAALYIADADGHSLYIDGIATGWGATGDALHGLIEAYGIEAGQQITVIGHRLTAHGQPTLTGAFYFSHTHQQPNKR